MLKIFNFFRGLYSFFKFANANDVVKSFNIHKSSKIFFSRKTKIDTANIEENVSIDFFKGSLKKLTIGRGSYLSGELIVYGYNGTLQIGKYCSMAGRLVLICGESFHQSKRLSTYPFPFMSPFKNYNIKDKLFDSISSFPETKIIIGNDVSIGEDVLITKNVQIGNGAVIAAKSVLIHDVPPYAIVIGNPATIVSYRYSKKEIEMIEKIKWWNWSTKKIIENIHIFKMTKNELNKELERIIKNI